MSKKAYLQSKLCSRVASSVCVRWAAGVSYDVACLCRLCPVHCAVAVTTVFKQGQRLVVAVIMRIGLQWMKRPQAAAGNCQSSVVNVHQPPPSSDASPCLITSLLLQSSSPFWEADAQSACNQPVANPSSQQPQPPQSESQQKVYQSTGRALMIFTSVVGLSVASVWMLPRRFTTSIPEHTRPKMVCLPSRKGAGANVTKN